MWSVEDIFNWVTTLLPLIPTITPLLKPSLTTDGKPSYTPQIPPLDTPWTPTGSTKRGSEVVIDAWKTHPRPQLKRKQWKSLNGVWTYRNASAEEASLFMGEGIANSEWQVPSGWLDMGVLVPSCLESGISGIMNEPGSSQFSWFQTKFTVPTAWTEKVLLNFGAVDYEATVFINGKKAGWHRGGYARFSVDITPYLHSIEKATKLKSGVENELVVFVHDPTDSGDYNIPVGKQTNRPTHIFYTPCSGIWQPVFIEPVPESYITRLDVDADMYGQVNITVHTSDKSATLVNISVKDSSGVTTTAVGKADQPFTFNVHSPSLWSPSSPTLYTLAIQLGANASLSDNIDSYTAFRTISSTIINDIHLITLNSKPIFPFGTLDQGYWPDGIYTPPSPEAMEFDLKMAKRLGFNMVRKHIKVEMDTWFEACDKLGMLVMQDMPSLRALQTYRDKDGVDKLWMPTSDQQEEFVKQLEEMIQLHKSFPSIFIWVIYNEGWGQLPSHPEFKLVELVRSLDPTRLIDAASGWHDAGAGDFSDNHHYANPQCGAPVYSYESGPFDPLRIGFQGEFGGLAHNVSVEHLWNVPNAVNGINQTYEVDGDLESWNYRAHTVLSELVYQTKRYNCAGGVYTQTTDVEGELNGLVTYDRRIFRPDIEQWKEDIQALYDAAEFRSEIASGH